MDGKLKNHFKGPFVILYNHFKGPFRSPRPLGGIARGRGVASANEAEFGSTAVRPKGALSGAGGAGAAAGRAARGAAAGAAADAAASEQTRMACHRTATDSHAKSLKSCSGAGGAGAV